MVNHQFIGRSPKYSISPERFDVQGRWSPHILKGNLNERGHISQHPEMSGPRIKRLLKKYTQCPEYWSTLTAGAPRIDLEGNVAGEVTVTDETDAKRKIAKEAGRAAAKDLLPVR